MDHDYETAERNVLAAIGVARILWGATTALAPGPVHRVAGIEYPGPDRGIWVKAFGVRDVLLGAAALHPDAAVRGAVYRSGIAMDLFDAGVAVSAARHGAPRRAVVIGLLFAGGTAAFAAVGPVVVRRSLARARAE